MDLIPHDLEAERGLVAIGLCSGHEAIEEITLATEIVGLFHDERLREVWNRMERLAHKKRPINAISVGKERVEFDIEASFIKGLDEDGIPLSFLKAYLPNAIEARKRRYAIDAARALANKAKDKTIPADAAISEAEETLFRCRFNADQDKSTQDEIQSAIKDWEDASKSPNTLSGISSGFPNLDKLTWGFQDRNLIVIGARPSQGKTALLCNIAENAAVEMKVPTLFFSVESAGKEIVKRIMCSMARVSSSDMRSGKDGGMGPITKASAKLNASPFHMVSRGTITIEQMRSLARRYQAKHGIQLILVDYLQKIRPSLRHEKRTYEVAQISEGLKEIAKELNVPVVVACQLNRESVKDKPRAPRPSDLGDSGAIERDADVIALLHRSSEPPENGRFKFNLLLVKHRDGPTGKVELRYRREFTRFDSPGVDDPEPESPQQEMYHD